MTARHHFINHKDNKRSCIDQRNILSKNQLRELIRSVFMFIIKKAEESL